MKIYPWLAVPVVATMVAIAPISSNAVHAATTPERKVEKAVEVFEEIMTDSSSRIPRKLLEQSQGIAIIPDVLRAGFFVGGTRGTGVMVVRDSGGTWSNPAFVSLTAGSFGLQFGAKTSDIVLVFKSRDALNQFMLGSFKFGGSISGTAGPLESSPVDSAKGFREAPVYTYSRSNGLFGGVSLEGSELGFDTDRNKSFYGKPLTPRQIFNDPFLTAPTVAEAIKDVIERAEAGVLSRF